MFRLRLREAPLRGRYQVLASLPSATKQEDDQENDRKQTEAPWPYEPSSSARYASHEATGQGEDEEEPSKSYKELIKFACFHSSLDAASNQGA